MEQKMLKHLETEWVQLEHLDTLKCLILFIFLIKSAKINVMHGIPFSVGLEAA